MILSARLTGQFELWALRWSILHLDRSKNPPQCWHGTPWGLLRATAMWSYSRRRGHPKWLESGKVCFKKKCENPWRNIVHVCLLLEILFGPPWWNHHEPKQPPPTKLGLPTALENGLWCPLFSLKCMLAANTQLADRKSDSKLLVATCMESKSSSDGWFTRTRAMYIYIYITDYYSISYPCIAIIPQNWASIFPVGGSSKNMPTPSNRDVAHDHWDILAGWRCEKCVGPLIVHVSNQKNHEVCFCVSLCFY